MKQQHLENELETLKLDLQRLLDCIADEWVSLANDFYKGTRDVEEVTYGETALLRVVKRYVGEEKAREWLVQIAKEYWGYK